MARRGELGTGYGGQNGDRVEVPRAGEVGDSVNLVRVRDGVSSLCGERKKGAVSFLLIAGANGVRFAYLTFLLFFSFLFCMKGRAEDRTKAGIRTLAPKALFASSFCPFS